VGAVELAVPVEGWSVMGTSLWFLVSGRRSEHRAGAAVSTMVRRSIDYQGAAEVFIFADAAD
jgi:hypothetical protein